MSSKYTSTKLRSLARVLVFFLLFTPTILDLVSYYYLMHLHSNFKFQMLQILHDRYAEMALDSDSVTMSAESTPQSGNTGMLNLRVLDAGIMNMGPNAVQLKDSDFWSSLRVFGTRQNGLLDVQLDILTDRRWAYDSIHAYESMYRSLWDNMDRLLQLLGMDSTSKRLSDLEFQIIPTQSVHDLAKQHVLSQSLPYDLVIISSPFFLSSRWARGNVSNEWIRELAALKSVVQSNSRVVLLGIQMASDQEWQAPLPPHPISRMGQSNLLWSEKFGWMGRYLLYHFKYLASMFVSRPLLHRQMAYQTDTVNGQESLKMMKWIEKWVGVGESWRVVGRVERELGDAWLGARGVMVELAPQLNFE